MSGIKKSKKSKVPNEWYVNISLEYTHTKKRQMRYYTEWRTQMPKFLQGG